MVESFRELRVYKEAFLAARTIFRCTESWPQEERYALTDQIRRSSRSVFANVAEAWRKRRYPKHFISKLSDADARQQKPVLGLMLRSIMSTSVSPRTRI
jgi:hypothetical protein